ncbi:hypothetical protein [Shewanella marina]|uniref:hypothetical protein n=1 Tax=Shewanella marina TaxID=487319 RepID=UPI000472DD77|nr:hypothetical protein [Shewanella marina]
MRPFVLSLMLVLLPLPAFAFSPEGSNATVFIILGLGGFTLLNLILQSLFYVSGRYQSKRFAQVHTYISLIMPILSVIGIFMDHMGWADMALNGGLVFIGTAFALLPLQLCTQQRVPSNRSASMLTIAGLCFTAIGAFITPVALFALATSHVFIRTYQDNKLKYLNYIILAVGYLLLAKWIYQLIQLWH